MTYIWPEAKLAYLVNGDLVLFENITRGREVCSHPLVDFCEKNIGIATDCREDAGAKLVVGPFITFDKTLDTCECAKNNFSYSMPQDKCVESSKLTKPDPTSPSTSSSGSVPSGKEPDSSDTSETDDENKPSNWESFFSKARYIYWSFGILTTVTSLSPIYFQAIHCITGVLKALNVEDSKVFTDLVNFMDSLAVAPDFMGIEKATPIYQQGPLKTDTLYPNDPKPDQSDRILATRYFETLSKGTHPRLSRLNNQIFFLNGMNFFFVWITFGLYFASSQIGNSKSTQYQSQNKTNYYFFKIARLIINIFRFRLLFAALTDIKMHSMETE